ncbi:MAG: hypothetical protein V4690_02670 [Patescibacteria group bacterium]
MFNKKIHNTFKKWGEKQVEFPPNNEVLKSLILEQVPNRTSALVSTTKHRQPWFFYAFTAMAVLTFVINSQPSFLSKMDLGDEFVVAPMAPQDASMAPEYAYPTVTTGSTAGRDSVIYDPYYPYPYPQNPNITDTREFSKIYYNPTLQTREVNDVRGEVERVVRNSDGRVDSSTSGEKSGYVSFVVPKDRLESFKDEIESLVGSRFYIEQTNTQNMLPQKQAIEQSLEQLDTTLKSLIKDRDGIVKNHNQNISAYNKRLEYINSEIARLNNEKVFYPALEEENTKRISALQNEIFAIQKEISSENHTYQTNKNNIDNSIKYTEQSLDYTKTQDKNLMLDVETVTGSVSIQWISLWDYVDTYFPGALLGWVFMALAVVAYFWNRNRKDTATDYYAELKL